MGGYCYGSFRSLSDSAESVSTDASRLTRVRFRRNETHLSPLDNVVVGMVIDGLRRTGETVTSIYATVVVRPGGLVARVGVNLLAASVLASVVLVYIL